MDGLRVLRNTQVIILGVCIAAATIVASVILSQGFIRVIKMTREQITVTGSANKQIISDYVVWQASVTVRDPDLAKGYKRLAADLDKVKKYLLAKGVPEQELVIPQVNTEQLYKKDEHGNDTNEFMDNRLTQLVEVRSENVSKITQVSREVTELIDLGVQLNSGAPEYLYRKLDELKLEMIRSARMGVLQITPSTSTDVSDMGINDTTSLDKKVTAVVTASFAIE